MKKTLYILLFCPLLFSLSTGKMQETKVKDTVAVKITDSVMAKAVEKTDAQIDSIFLQPRPITYQDITQGFGGMMKHMDSLNAAVIVLVKQRDSIQQARHLAQLDSIGMVNTNVMLINANMELKKENKKKEQRLKLTQSVYHFFYGCCFTYMVILFSRGVINGVKKIRKNAA